MNISAALIPEDFKTLRVLIVDDEPMLRSVIHDYLAILGIEHLSIAGDGLEALEIIRTRPIDCMLSDIRMPKMELEDLLEVVKQDFPRLIVLATSGFSDLESARNIFHKGAHDFIGKPLNLDALEMALIWVVERRRILDAASRLFGRSAREAGENEVDAGFALLMKMLKAEVTHFKIETGHAIRMARLAEQLQLGLDGDGRRDLIIASLLHDLGAGYQSQYLYKQARRLEENELQVVKVQSRISGRLAAQALGRPEFEEIIGLHLEWPVGAGESSQLPLFVRQLAVWLNLLNCVDGCLQDRPDRPALSLNHLRDILTRRHNSHPLQPIGNLLDQWGMIEGYYGEHR